MAKLMHPKININGMTREAHIAARVEVIESLRTVMDKLAETRPHGRDYLGDDAARNADLAIYSERFAVIDKLRNEIEEEALAIQDRPSTPLPARYQCIGDDLRGYFVEPKSPRGVVWMVPGTMRDDPMRRV